MLTLYGINLCYYFYILLTHFFKSDLDHRRSHHSYFKLISVTTKVILATEDVTTASVKVILATKKVILTTEEVITTTFKVNTLGAKGFFQFEIIINALISSFRFIWIPMLWVYGQ